MALFARPRFRPVSETRKKGGGDGERGRNGENRGEEVSFPGHCGLVEMQEEPLIN